MCGYLTNEITLPVYVNENEGDDKAVDSWVGFLAALERLALIGIPLSMKPRCGYIMSQVRPERCFSSPSNSLDIHFCTSDYSFEFRFKYQNIKYLYRPSPIDGDDFTCLVYLCDWFVSYGFERDIYRLFSRREAYGMPCCVVGQRP